MVALAVLFVSTLVWLAVFVAGQIGEHLQSRRHLSVADEAAAWLGTVSRPD